MHLSPRSCALRSSHSGQVTHTNTSVLNTPSVCSIPQQQPMSKQKDVFNLLSSFCAVQSTQQVSSVVMTEPELRFSRVTRSGEVPPTEGMTGGHHRTKSPPKCQDSPTGSTTWSRFTTAACGRITATTISDTARPATAGRTSLPKQVRKRFLSYMMS